MTEQGNSIAASAAVDCIEQADAAVAGSPPLSTHLLAKAQVYATLAVAEVLERIEQSGDPVFTRD